MPSPYSQEGAQLAAVAEVWPNPLVASSTGGDAANNVSITPPADAYVTGFEITGGEASGASVITITLTGLTAADTTFTYYSPIPAGVNDQALMIVEFSTPIPGQGIGEAISLNVPTFDTKASATLHGFSA
jgi:hypothetical protein